MKNKLFKKKILHRAKYRGIKELDIIFERFVAAYQEKITSNELIELEQILDLPDNELLDFIFKKQSIPSNLRGTILEKIIKNCDVKD